MICWLLNVTFLFHCTFAAYTCFDRRDDLDGVFFSGSHCNYPDLFWG